MLSQSAQNNLLKKFSGKELKKSLNENFSGLEALKNKIENKSAYSSVIYFDICDFSEKIIDFTPQQVNKYLCEFYNRTLQYIRKYKGQIDRLVGDGVIAVFSKIFSEISSDEKASNNSFYCCKEIVEELYNTEFESKAAIGNGNLFFCKTGAEQIYEEHTAVGYPFTVAYRLENIAQKNQILLMRNINLSKRIISTFYGLDDWEYEDIEVDLKGIKSNVVRILQY